MFTENPFPGIFFMANVDEILQSAASALALDDIRQAKRILERYEQIREKFQSHGVFDAKSWEKYDQKYGELKKRVEKSF